MSIPASWPATDTDSPRRAQALPAVPAVNPISTWLRWAYIGAIAALAWPLAMVRAAAETGTSDASRE